MGKENNKMMEGNDNRLGRVSHLENHVFLDQYTVNVPYHKWFMYDHIGELLRTNWSEVIETKEDNNLNTQVPVIHILEPPKLYDGRVIVSYGLIKMSRKRKK